MEGKGFYTIQFVWSKTVWVITFALFGLWIGVSGWILWNICVENDPTMYLLILLEFNAIMLPCIIICEGLAPQRLEISSKKIVILRRFKNVAIFSYQVQSVEALPKNALRGAIRTFGVGGLFGYYGNYYTTRIGSFKLYATSFDNLFLIRLKSGKKIVISCSEPDKMSIFAES